MKREPGVKSCVVAGKCRPVYRMTHDPFHFSEQIIINWKEQIHYTTIQAVGCSISNNQST